MKIILRDSVEGLGEIGETVTVADGYARNYLIPRKVAVSADSGSAKQIEHEIRNIRRREEKKRAELMNDAKKLEKTTVNLVMRAGPEDRLYGSVTPAHIADKLKEQGFAVDRKNIHIPEPIKSLGIHKVAVRLGLGVEAQIKVWVEKEGGEEAAESAKETDAGTSGESS
ncbi:MAG: 50S ribosomal protein L9 [Candidatus Hydrogenedentota bacterium]